MSHAAATADDARFALADFMSPVASELAAVERQLQAELTSRHKLVDTVVRHGYRLGGKRLRPALVLLAGKASGELTADHTLLGTVVEMIHTATLVHDDVLDEADLRRHVDTVNARWGNETSVLLGDFLFSHAFYLASTLNDASYCRIIGKTTNRVCEGEMLQTLGGGNFALSEAEYFEIIDAKTAQLCACCCELGARRSGANATVIRALSEYGRLLGMAFQIADDLLDLVGQQQQTGKTLGRDLAKGKLTLPLIHARDTLVDGAQRRFVERLAAGELTGAELVTRLRETDSLSYTHDTAQRLVQAAQSQLQAIPDSPTRQLLHGLADYVISRQS
jgi:octaprenyl-diphosphate synthase